jgi:hypothetical protein
VATSFIKGDSTDFIDSQWADGVTASPSAANHHPSHLKQQVVLTLGGATHTLNVWVADDCWSTDGTTLANTKPASASGTSATTAWAPPNHLVTPTMVDALATAFLTNGTDDIYGWVTSLVGQEWAMTGSPSYSWAGQGFSLVDAEGNLHIFICNLNPDSTSSGVMLGYFHANNNFVGYTGSNAKILFALDADSLANPSPDGKKAETPASWAVTAYWPSEIRSTLAHEFQHMIQFYQKQIVHDLTADTDSWINEMASMVTEDLVSDKLNVIGPRGVVGKNYATGSAGNFEGRFPDFLLYHDEISLTGWGISGDPDSTAWTLESYANSYAFGAWLVRNYGGPAFLKSLVTNDQTTEQAVVDAVVANGGTGQTFDSLVRQWGLSVFLESSQQQGLAYSAGAGGFSWTTPENLTYRLGSIDLGNYLYSSAYPSGPFIYSGVLPWAADVYPGASVFDYVETLSGTTNHTLTLPPHVALTVVVTP